MPDEYGAIMPTREENYVFLKQFFGEIFNTFPDPFVHLGGDEVSYYCWYIIYKISTTYFVLNYSLNWLKGNDIQRLKLLWLPMDGELILLNWNSITLID